MVSFKKLFEQAYKEVVEEQKYDVSLKDMKDGFESGMKVNLKDETGLNEAGIKKLLDLLKTEESDEIEVGDGFVVIKTFEGYKEFLKALEEVSKEISEAKVVIKVKHPGILEVPPDKKVTDLPVEHFIKLARKKGYAAIIRALNNLQVWNKNRNKELSAWAKKMKEELRKAREQGKI